MKKRKRKNTIIFSSTDRIKELAQEKSIKDYDYTSFLTDLKFPTFKDSYEHVGTKEEYNIKSKIKQYNKDLFSTTRSKERFNILFGFSHSQ